MAWYVAGACNRLFTLSGTQLRRLHILTRTLANTYSTSTYVSIRRVLENMGISIPTDGAVPPDFVIAQSADIKHISKIAQKLGLQENEYNLHGPSKAKVCDAFHLRKEVL
jgi:hypothetical protein